MNIAKLMSRPALALVCFLLALPLSAQMPTFFVEDATAFPDEEVAVNVRISNSSMVTGIQFSVNWNPDQLTYLGVTNIALNRTYEGNFNRSQLDTARLGFVFVDQALNPLELTDSAILFTLRFEPVPNSGFSSVVGFHDTPISTRAGDTEGGRVEVNTDDGRVDLGALAALEVVSEHPRFGAHPNPFSDRVRLELVSTYANPRATLEILTLDGRTAHQRSVSVVAGTNTYDLYAGNFPSAGAYVVRVTTDREQLHRKVVLGPGGR